GRVLGIPLTQVDKVAKLIPGELGITISRALEIAPDLKALYQNNSEIHELIDLAMAVEGMPRHTSTHAAGVVIAKEPLTNYLPLQKTNDNVAVTQFPMKTVEEIGLLKMDFLGLRNLTIIEHALRLIRENRQVTIDLQQIPMDDPLTYRLLAAGDTAGVFQLESSGMRAILKELKPTVFEDIIAVNALYRPGPMEQIPEFVRRKHGAAITYLHPTLEKILKNTYGIIVYQEQVMQIARDLAGYSLGRADLLRRAMGKKKKEIMVEERRNFVHGLKTPDGEVIIPGAANKGIDENLANSIFDLMAKFAQYGFNKGHATAYAVISYQTAWLKANYPQEFMAALLTSVMGSADKVSFYIEECRKMGIEVLPPDVNESFESFTLDGGNIRFGLAAIKNIGLSVVQAIIQGRGAGPYQSLVDFCERVDCKTLNKRVMESLIKSGAFASLSLNRAQLMQMLAPSLEYAEARQKEKASGQFSLFDFGATEVTEVSVPSVQEFDNKEILAMEKEVLGLYLSGHPLKDYAERLQGCVTHRIAELVNARDGVRVKLAGIITACRKTVTKKGEAMAYFVLEDLNGTIETLVFPRIFLKVGALIDNDRLVYVEGRLSQADEGLKIFADNIRDLAEKLQESARDDKAKCKLRRGQTDDSSPKQAEVYVKLPGNSKDLQLTERIRMILGKYPGAVPVYLYFEHENKVLKVNRALWVEASAELQRELAETWGPDCIKIK
ncbi:MAG TPA: DNA polymerase III subunit alpha, partial [Desulfobacteria bacterium]|nr:DNA polymerase III subunit alpha [Desulfobacteria bacterium]